MDEKFLMLVQEREPLYNTTIKEHTNRIVLSRCWKEISEEMNMPVSRCQAKWINLRNSYARHLRSTKNDAIMVKSRKAWYLAKNMSFLEEFMQSRGAKKVEGSNGTYLDLDLECVEGLVEEQEVIQLPQVIDCSASEKKIESIGDIQETICIKPKTVKRQKVLSELKKCVEKECEITKDTQLPSANQPQHPLLSFFTSLLPDYDKLTARRQRLFRQSALSLINDLLDEQESS